MEAQNKVIILEKDPNSNSSGKNTEDKNGGQEIYSMKQNKAVTTSFPIISAGKVIGSVLSTYPEPELSAKIVNDVKVFFKTSEEEVGKPERFLGRNFAKVLLKLF